MKKIIYFSIFVFFTHFIHAQKHDNIWILGNNQSSSANYGASIIDFNLGLPEISPMVLPINMKSANSTFSDTGGNFLFYSNGIKIINTNHDLMENGDSLNAGQIAFDNLDKGYTFPSMFPLGFVNNSNKVYLIHQRGELPNVSNPHFDIYLYWTEIDLSANNGIGKVNEKNQLIHGGVDFYLDLSTATKHANGRDWWIVTPYQYESKYHTILLTPYGITQEFIQNVGFKPDPLISLDMGGVNVFSPNGRLYIDSDGVNGLRVFDFDRCTGELAHRENIEATSFVYNVVSPNSKYLYSANANHMVQYDLTMSNIASSLDTLAMNDGPHWSGFTWSQVASNGKIYSAAGGGNNYLHIIHQPNKKGIACQIAQYAIELPYFNHTSLPQYPNYRLGPTDGSPCDSLDIDNHPLAGFNCFVLDSLQQEVEFVDNSHYEPTDWYWTFGDGNTSTEMSPVHTYAESGIYEVCLVVNNVNSSDTLCKLVEFMTSGVEEVLAQEHGKIKIIPNPSSGEFSIQFLEAERIQDLHLVVYNSLGQRVFEKILNESYTHDIHLPRLDAGIYFCEFLSKGELIQQEKLVIVNP